MLPGATGLEICQWVRGQDDLADIPIVIVSARTQESDVEAGLEAGADAYLKKPLSNQHLVDTVRRFLADSPKAASTKAPLEDLDRKVEKGLIAIQRYLAEIERSQRAYKSYLERLESHNDRPLAEKQQAARQAAEMVRRQIRRNQAAGWQVLKDMLERLELKESAIRRRGKHEPMGAKSWQMAAARAHFVKEDCRRWAESVPEQILREYESALSDGDRIYAYLIQRYGTEALQQTNHWEQLSLLRARILEVDTPSPEELDELDALYDRINPLRAKLTGVDLPDALLLIERNTPSRQSFNGQHLEVKERVNQAG
jgi:CheY-like chemotaxis protein